MKLGKALLITKKDWKEIFQSRITAASIILPFFIPLGISLALVMGFKYYGDQLEKFISLEELEMIKQAFPDITGMETSQMFIYISCVLVTPLLFIVFSLASTSIITADSFAGEKERKTIEALLATPLDDIELFIGKLLASFIPSISLTYIFFVITTVAINTLTGDLFGYIWYPPIEVIVAVIVVAPLYAFLGMTFVIWGSSKVTSVRDASNFAGILIIPILVFVMGMMIGSIVINPINLLFLSVVLVLIDCIAFYICYKTFDREIIVSKT